MQNKLGLNELDVLDLEEALVSYKTSLLNEKISPGIRTVPFILFAAISKFLLLLKLLAS